jgi:hypothetical protein
MQIWQGDDPAHVKVWNLASGEPLFDLHFPTTERFEVAFSPDGRILATWDQKRIVLWELATRQVAWEFDAPKKRSFVSVQFISDDRILALSHWTIADLDVEDMVRIWDVWQRKELYAAQEGPHYVRCAALSSDGALLASASSDTSILLWKLPPPRKANSKVPNTKDLHRIWADLAGSDVPAAYQAIRALVSDPEQAVSLLKTHLRPAPHTHTTQLIAHLDDDQFQVREAASRDLARLGEEAEPALRRAAKSGSLEVRRRAEKLLQCLQDHPKELNPDQLRGIRANQVLEQVGNQDAIQLLQQLSNGSPEARLTQEAKASLGRLMKRTAMRN